MAKKAGPKQGGPPAAGAPRKAGRPAGKPTIDWGAAERLYVQGEVSEADGTRTFPTYGAVAIRMGVGPGAVAMHGGESRWPQKREAFQQALHDEIERKCIENGAQAAARAVSLGAETAGKAARLIAHMLGAEPPPGIDPKWTAPTADTLDRVVKLGRLFKDLATGARYLSGGTPGGQQGPPVEDPADLPPLSEAETIAALKAIHDTNQAPGGPDGTEPAHGRE